MNFDPYLNGVGYTMTLMYTFMRFVTSNIIWLLEFSLEDQSRPLTCKAFTYASLNTHYNYNYYIYIACALLVLYHPIHELVMKLKCVCIATRIVCNVRLYHLCSANAVAN